MAESGSETATQSESALEEGDLRTAVDNLSKLFDAQFETSEIKENGTPLAKQNPAPTGFGGLGGGDYDFNILMLNSLPGSTEPSWRTDRSENNKIKVVRMYKSGIEETAILDTSNSPSIQYEFLDRQYKHNPRQLPELMIKRKAKDTQVAVDKAKHIIADIPQVKT